MIFIGVDPGVSGSIVALRATVDKFHSDIAGMQRLSDTEHEISRFLFDMAADGECFAFVEKVHAMPKQGVRSMFTFGQNYGMVRGMLAAHRIPFDDVTPQRWQKELGCLSKGDKNTTKAKAGQLFPQVKVAHWFADGLLIAEFCRRVRLNERPGAYPPAAE